MIYVDDDEVDCDGVLMMYKTHMVEVDVQIVEARHCK